MSKIKILYTIPNFETAGSGKVVFDLVKNLDKSRFAPEICCHRKGGAFFKKVESLDVPIHVFNLSPSYHPFYKIPWHVYKSYKFFKKHRFDLIHSWHWSSDVIEPLAAKLAKIPFVYTKKAMSWGSKSWVWRSKWSTRIITINSDMQPAFFRGMKEKVTYMPLGIDTNYYCPMPKTELKYSENKMLKNKDFLVVSVANLVAVKGIEILIEAILQLKNPNIKLWIVGDHNNQYGQNLKILYHGDQIQFLGKKQDVRPYLAWADAFVIPTKDEGRKEGLPVAPMEAMASGKIVLGSEISGIKDLLEPFKECLFEPGNVKELSVKLKGLLTKSKEERAQLAIQMRNQIKENYNLVSCIQAHENLYKEITNRR